MTVAPYGTWHSPLSAERVSAGVLKFLEIRLDGDTITWTEQRPSEGGRHVIVARDPDGTTRDLTPAGFNVRTRAHEYGGGPYTVADGTAYFSNFTDHLVYRQRRTGEPQPLTLGSDFFYADLIVDRMRDRLIAVREDHTSETHEAVSTLVSIPLETAGLARVLVSGNDFYSSPKLTADGSKLAWLTWNHPNMPWDGTELWMAELDAAGALGTPLKIAGGPNESIFQPEWSPDGVLHFVSDRTGWWNLYRWRAGVVEPVLPMEAEFGQPQWVFGMSTYAFDDHAGIVCSYTTGGRWHLVRLTAGSSQLELLADGLEPYGQIRVASDHLVFLGGTPRTPEAVLRVSLTTGQVDEIRRATEDEVDTGLISEPQAIEYVTASTSLTINAPTAHAFFYPPKNSEFDAPSGERPPLLVISHGGPTSAATTSYNPRVQYWTTRGFAVLDVNYGGSTGYGRAYRQRLNGMWGLVDVLDCINGAQFLVQQGLVDENRLAIRGGSAGGYTTLAALTFHKVFKAGASYFGVSDIETLARDTHKFESRYMDTLVGPYPASQDIYRARSPIHFIDHLSCPLILFQGLDDKIVPPSQSEAMADAVAKRGLPVAYLAFEGEQHGFRRADTLVRSLEAELAFYGVVFGFTPADEIPPIDIKNR